jgi:hypothetical protein
MDRIGFRADLFEGIREYYSWASEQVWHGRFKMPLDRRIWALHALGRSAREIGHATGFERSWVNRKIRAIREYLRMKQRSEGRLDDAA